MLGGKEEVEGIFFVYINLENYIVLKFEVVYLCDLYF